MSSITDYVASQQPSTASVSQVSTTGASATASGAASLASSYQSFLTLLTAQLKNQDPLSPMDSTQFTQQLVQMTGVQQQLLSNDLLQKLVNAGTSSSNLNAVGLIGKTVTAASADTNLKNGAATWTYELDTAAKDATLEITNARGQTVWSGPAPSLDTGQHAFTWNGVSSAGGAQGDGVYTLKVTAHDTNDALLTAKTFITGTATALEQNSGVTSLMIGGVKISIGDINSVTTATA